MSGPYFDHDLVMPPDLAGEREQVLARTYEVRRVGCVTERKHLAVKISSLLDHVRYGLGVAHREDDVAHTRGRNPMRHERGDVAPFEAPTTVMCSGGTPAPRRESTCAAIRWA